MLDQNSAVYSDRPFPVMAGQLLRREKSIFLMKYGERLKTTRRLMHQDFNPTASQKYWGVQEAESRLMVMNLLQQSDPQHLEGHLRKNAAAVIMHIAYGYTIKSSDDYFVAMAEESMRVASLAATPGKWLVDSFPILRFIPRWFPGASFRRSAEEWSSQLYTQSLVPFNFVKEQMTAGTAKPSFTSLHLQPPVTEEDEDIVLWTAGALYAGAADTTTSTVKTFFLMMCLYPDIQRRAQDELDRVVGNDRLPTLTDRAHLPFINNVISEILRWAPPSPMGLPHSATRDDVFSGYFIPKGCTIFANIWAILHDESVYPDPYVFNPDRYDAKSGKAQPDPRQWVFGFGRRICAGMHIAESAVFIQIATVLATLDILRAVDEEGREIIPEIAFSTAIVSYVKSFPYQLKPRSAAAVSLIQNAVAAMD
ncbi:cytochrome P450 [Fomitiporia mediterranea MF3/22]|uniref:cytochrome P450 n=1 Tax=Fomitiporia mediterranea (strain MF3/22) TaxID=694068 RepID=UPI0004407F8D|nr:cytochrome P450 [Fomitiporia mediterranea MF3/22]EJD00102.1 cytochrome P450 [Fomitiporia mediterranea MF3/22]